MGLAAGDGVAVKRVLRGAPCAGEGRAVPGCRRRRRTGGRRLLAGAVAGAVLALGLGGLPLTGGALAKLAVKAPLGDGVVGTLADLSAAGTTLLMLHFLQRLARGLSAQDGTSRRLPLGLSWPWLVMALAPSLVPWLLYPFVGGDIADALTPGALLDALWPVLIGAALAFVLRR